jgi:hypothetical protein
LARCRGGLGTNDKPQQDRGNGGVDAQARLLRVAVFDPPASPPIGAGDPIHNERQFSPLERGERVPLCDNPRVLERCLKHINGWRDVRWQPCMRPTHMHQRDLHAAIKTPVNAHVVDVAAITTTQGRRPDDPIWPHLNPSAIVADDIPQCGQGEGQ